MASNTPQIQTISGKVRTRYPLQADSLDSRYQFLNLQNAEPNLGVPNTVDIKDEYPGDDGYRYMLLSNNTQSGSAWRVWSYNTPRIAVYSKENSIAFGDNANPIWEQSVVFNNHPYGTNVWNSQAFGKQTFNVFSLSGIFLYDSTTIGDPLSAITFIVTDDQKVGINTDTPNEALTVSGTISGNNNFYIKNNSYIGNVGKEAITTLGGRVQIADSSPTSMLFGFSNSNYDTNLYRAKSNTLKTDSNLVTATLSSVGGLSAAYVELTNASVTLLPTTTASGEFLLIKINGANRALRLWNY
jgi:hypothetical protein